MAEIILLVENDEAVRGWLQQKLTDGSGAHVVAVGSAAEAIAKVRQHAPDIAAVVCDIRLNAARRPPELQNDRHEPDGFALARWVREQLPAAGVYGMTGLMDKLSPTQKQWFQEAGDPVTGIGVYNKYRDWPLLRHRLLLRVGRQTQVQVFIVHGHEPGASPSTRDELAKYARGLGWRPEILQEGHWRSRTWIESIETHAASASLAWVLFTADEWGCPLAPNLQPERRPRPNVLLECGYFLGAFGRDSGRVVIFRKGDVAVPSDLEGVGRVELTGPVASHDEKIKREIAPWLP